jgi:hypothetical protein
LAVALALLRGGHHEGKNRRRARKAAILLGFSVRASDGLAAGIIASPIKSAH